MDWKSLVEQFLNDKSLEKNLSKNTQMTYRNQLKGYINHLDNLDRVPATVSRADILSYLAKKKERGLKEASLFCAAFAIRLFHRYLSDREITPADPTAGMSLPPFNHKIPEPLTRLEMERLIGLSDGTAFSQIRMKAALELLYSTGMRISELLSLRLDQVHVEKTWLKVLGKGRKERVLPFSPKAQAALRSYLEARAKRPNQISYFVFLNSKGRPLTRGGFWWQLNQLSQTAKMKSRLFPHRIRHTAATLLLAGGADLKEVQEYLGHVSVATTQRYLHVTVDRLRQVCQTAHPAFS